MTAGQMLYLPAGEVQAGLHNEELLPPGAGRLLAGWLAGCVGPSPLLRGTRSLTHAHTHNPACRSLVLLQAGSTRSPPTLPPALPRTWL